MARPYNANAWNRGKGAAVAWLRAHAAHQGDECLTWPFSRIGKGYGSFGYLRKQLYAHRFMCELVHGPAPSPQHQAAHSCGKGHEGCVNPRHLSWKTNSENQLDRSAHGNREPKRRTILTVEQVTTIRALKGHKTQREIADMFGVKPGCIEYWQKGDRMPAPRGTSQSALWRRAKADRDSEQEAPRAQEG
jgi:hypothetical protein